MSLVIKLHPGPVRTSHNRPGRPVRRLIAETEHGASVPLPDDPAEIGLALISYLERQEQPKVIAPGVDGDVMALVLAEWERVGHPGDGRGLRRRVAAQAEPGVRIFTKSGKELLPL